MILTHDLIGHFSAIELTWVLIAISGLLLSRLNGAEAWSDFNALGGKQNGRRRIAVGNLRREAVRGFVNACFLLVGIAAGLTPANPNATLLGVAVSGVLIVASIAYNLNSWLDRQERIYLMTNGLQGRDEAGRFTSD